jgi:hypothetical protein
MIGLLEFNSKINFPVAAAEAAKLAFSGVPPSPLSALKVLPSAGFAKTGLQNLHFKDLRYQNLEHKGLGTA